ncbi:MAG: hypothetical protein ABEJ93_00650 [Candidatus Nanohalobium sp.]
MKTEEKLPKEKVRKIIAENREGLESLAKEEPAKEERDHPIKMKLKRIYRKHIRKPKAEPLVI